MPPTTHEKAHMWQATMGTTHTRRSPMGTVLDQGVRSPRYPSTMPKSLRHPRDKVCLAGSISPLLSCAKRRRFGSLRSLVQLPKDANLIWLVSPDSGRQSCEVCPPRSRDNICTTSLSIALCHWRLISFAAGGSMPGQEEDISPYATFHLLGMREEVTFNFKRALANIRLQSVQWSQMKWHDNGRPIYLCCQTGWWHTSIFQAKNGMMPNGMTPNGMMTMPATPGQGPSMTQPSTPAHQRQQGNLWRNQFEKL